MDTVPITAVFNNNPENLINLGYITVHEQDDGKPTFTLSMEGKSGCWRTMVSN
jgi:hypothetical protein